MGLERFKQLGLTIVAGLTGGEVVDVPDHSELPKSLPIQSQFPSSVTANNPAAVIAAGVSGSSQITPSHPLSSTAPDKARVHQVANGHFTDTLEAATGKLDGFFAALDRINAKQGSKAGTPDALQMAMVSAAVGQGLSPADVEAGFRVLFEACTSRRAEFDQSQQSKRQAEVDEPRGALAETRARIIAIQKEIGRLQAELKEKETSFEPAEAKITASETAISQAGELFSGAESEVMDRLNRFKEQILAACS